MNTSDLPVIELSGTPLERGRTHGKAAKLLIARLLSRWRDDLGSFYQGDSSREKEDPDTYLSAFFRETSYIQAIKQWAPDLLEEVHGIAEGAEQEFQDILGLQLVDEEWVFGLRRRLDKPTTKCTAFGVPNQDGGISFAGQNLDAPSWIEGGQVLLRLAPTENSPETLIFTMAGNLGINGLNANGLGITVNTLAQLNYSTEGLPVGFIVRSVLGKNSIDQAEQFLRAIKHASGQNYILSSPGDVRCFECCATSVAQYAPKYYRDGVFHSNHPLINKDESELKELTNNRFKNSKARLDSICKRLGDTSKTITLEDTKAALAAHDDPDNPVSRNTNNDSDSIGFTAGSSIYELGAVPRLHLAAGPPCETAFEVFDFKTL
jgi:hypothetical protein